MKKSKKTEILLQFLHKTDYEDFFYALRNYSDDLCAADPKINEQVQKINNRVSSLKRTLKILAEEAIERGEVENEEIPECIDYW